MRCTRPIYIQNGHKIDKLPCGYCTSCRVNRITEWTTRILHESWLNNDNIFVTLTYNEDNLPPKGSVNKRDLQLFFKRVRKEKKCRYFACAEYGDSYDRPHYHTIIFGLSERDRTIIEQAWATKYRIKKVDYYDSWGFVHIGNVTEQSARYCAQYISKQLYGKAKEAYKGKTPEFLLTSRHPGIGSEIANKYLDKWAKIGYTMINGSKRPIPKYYINKLTEGGKLDYQKSTQNKILSKYYGGEKEILKNPDDTRIQRNLNLEAKIKVYSRRKYDTQKIRNTNRS